MPIDEKEFEQNYSGILERLKDQKAECPDVEQIRAYATGELNPDRIGAIEDHLSCCAPCLQLQQRMAEEPAELDDLRWKKIEKRLDARPAPWDTGRPASPWLSRVRGLRAAAAIVVVVAAAVLWVWIERTTLEPGKSAVTGPISTTRGVSIQAVTPVDQVETMRLFEWSTIPIEADFRLQISGPDGVLWTATTRSQKYLPPPELLERLEPEVRYRWMVQALNEDGKELARSSPIEFQIER